MAELAGFYERLLVIRCQGGDRAAFENLVGLYQPRLRAFLFKMRGGPQAIDDLAQDVWMDVFRDIRKLNEPGAFRYWLYRIARNRVYRSLRRRPLAMESIQSDVPDESEETHFNAEDAAYVKEAMDGLSPEHREVLLLRFVEEMSYEQIAQVVGCHLGTVRSRIHNAKRSLREIIERKSDHGSR